MFNYYATCFKKYVDFSGRATRAEYWSFALINFLVMLVLQIIGSATLVNLYSLAVFIPGLAVFWRRMHDTDRSGCNFFWIFLPLIGLIIVLVYLLLPTKPGENKYAK